MIISDKIRQLAIIIPGYNEEGNILRLIKELRRFVPKSCLIIVDGNSQDKTVAIVKRAQKTDPALTLLRQSTKSGRGAAVIMGLREALKNRKTKFFLEMDADLSHYPEEVGKLLGTVDDETIAIASRYLPESEIIDWPEWRLRQSHWANRLINFVLNLGLQDNTNGFRCYPRCAVELLVEHQFISRGFILLSESAYFLKRKGYTLLEIPSTFRDRRKGKSSAGLKELLASLFNLFRIKLFVN